MNNKYNIKTSRILFAIFAIIITLSSCEKEEQYGDFPDITSGAGLFVINEGNYGWGNASLGYVSLLSDKSYHKLFESANNRPLGDVFQSISHINDKLFLVVNNSGKIEITDPISLKSIATISGITSPRNITQVDESTALVTDLYAKRIHIINLDDYTVSGYIQVSGWTEEVVILNDNIFVSNMDKSLIYLIDRQSLQLTDSIYTAPMPGKILVENNTLWVLCAGLPENNVQGALISIDVEAFEVNKSIDLSPASFANMAISPDKDKLYILTDDLYEISTSNPAMPETPIISASGMLLYGLAVDPSNGDIYIADAIDYVQRGAIMRYNSSGTFIKKYDADIIPGGFFFY